ncbi:MAG: threonine synthase [Clostridiales bacterium]|nr:threonine synthase [Clostridiales bacterium]
MNYKSTRNSKISVNSANAIVKGLSDEGGLFVPDGLPKLTKEQVLALGEKSYAQRAYDIFSLFLTDFTTEEVLHCVNSAYNDRNFDTNNISELKKLNNKTHILELWHGPTCAFKDMALQILPFLLTTSAKKTVDGKKIAILVATSGDTGKAALEGFKDVDGTSVSVFYPVNGVSLMQKRQMATQEGSNVDVCAVEGNFDDCQSGVKEIFVDKALAEELKKHNILLSSANSINWGRLAPQIIYYISSYAQLVKNGDINFGEKLNVVVPTGNFGNILAAFYAKEMGVPIGKLICASNANNVLTDFIKTGVYDRNREFHQTVSPSMDILISSNLERLLYHLSGENDKLISQWFDSLKKNGRYEVSSDVKERLSESFYGGFCDDNATKQTIKAVFDKFGYLIDTHTAVAYKVYEDYKACTGDESVTLIASTANPYKFSPAVLEALGGKADGNDEFEIIDRLERASGTKAPTALMETKDKQSRFNDCVDKVQMPERVLKFLTNK